jgi:hypothetical protein
MIDILSGEVFNTRVVATDNDDITEAELTSVITGIVQQCSKKIFQVDIIRKCKNEKIMMIYSVYR